MSGQPQKNQPEQGILASPVESRSDAPKAIVKGTETPNGEKREAERLAGTERLMEEVCELEKLQAGIATSQGQQGKSGSARDDRRGTSGIPETA